MQSKYYFLSSILKFHLQHEKMLDRSNNKPIHVVLHFSLIIDEIRHFSNVHETVRTFCCTNISSNELWSHKKNLLLPSHLVWTFFTITCNMSVKIIGATWTDTCQTWTAIFVHCTSNYFSFNCFLYLIKMILHYKFLLSFFSAKRMVIPLSPVSIHALVPPHALSIISSVIEI